MAKKPPDTPEVLDKVKLRGRDSNKTGVLMQRNSNDWCRVDWVNGGPTICHLYELEKING